MSSAFQYYAPTRVVFGEDSVDRTGELVREAGGTRVLLHYGGGSAVRSGLIARIRRSLEAAGVGYALLGGAVPNPHLGKIREGIELGLHTGVDFVLAVGGGSVIDSAKGIAYGIADPELDVWELYERKKAARKCLPVGVVLTIAAAGSEMSNDSVVTNEQTGRKRSYGNDIARARFAVMDPKLTLTLPDWQTMAGCTDIMMHTMERYFVNGPTMELTDELAEGLLRTVMRNAEILHRDPEDLEARKEVMWAGSLSHNGLMSCGVQGGKGDFACHIMEHELSGKYDVTHGAGLAAIWGSWARYVYRDCLHRFFRYAVKVMGVRPDPGIYSGDAAESQAATERTALAGIEAMEAFYRRIGMPTDIRGLGIEASDDDVREMAHYAAIASGGKRGSARVLYEEDMEAILGMAR